MWPCRASAFAIATATEAEIAGEMARLRAGALYSDPGAPYAAVHRFDLEHLPITIARPHRVDHTVHLDDLGHVHVADTQWYLDGCPELMHEAMKRLQQRWEDRP